MDRERVLAFRLNSHNLARRLSPGSLGEVAAACGIQNTPPGAAALSLWARVDQVTRAAVDRAVVLEKTLLQIWSLRAAPCLVPTAEAGVFTRGLRPDDEEALRFFIRGSATLLDQIGISATALVEQAGAALREVLDGRRLAKDELALALATRVSERLASGYDTDTLNRLRSPIAGQGFWETLMRFALYVLPLQGLLCFAERQDNRALLSLMDQWLGAPLPRVDEAEARAELVRRYLRCYGPSTVDHFAQWAGMAPAQARRAWEGVEAELVAVDFAGRRTWLRRQDIASLASSPRGEGVRLLPPHDPYLQLRDRDTLLADRARQREIWRMVGNPGVVLAAGEVVAMWRPENKGRRLTVNVTGFGPLAPGVRGAIEAEVDALGTHLGLAAVEARFF